MWGIAPPPPSVVKDSEIAGADRRYRQDISLEINVGSVKTSDLGLQIRRQYNTAQVRSHPDLNLTCIMCIPVSGNTVVFDRRFCSNVNRKLLHVQQHSSVAL